jgi:hypothetical protein
MAVIGLGIRVFFKEFNVAVRLKYSWNHATNILWCLFLLAAVERKEHVPD